MPKVNQSLNYKIAMTGIFGALSVVLAVTPIGFITIPGTFISITIMHIPAILAAVTAGLVPGVGVGLIFGVASLIRTAMNGGGANPFFLNPLVSVLPRMIFPLIAWGIYRLLNLIPKMPRVISGGIAAAFGTFFHTLLVMGAIYLLYGETLVSGMGATLANFGIDVANISSMKIFIGIMTVTLATNGVWEIVAATVLAVAVLGSMYAVQNRKSRLSKFEDESQEQ